MFQHRAGVVLLAALASLSPFWTDLVAGQGTPVVILDETFEGTFPSADWHLFGDPTWQTDDFKPYTGAMSAWCARGGWTGLDPQFSNYADNLDARDPSQGGCDTIFLLSDGSPTGADGQVLEPDVSEAAWTRVKEANRVFRCVIHTVGIGRLHNSPLMRRIAQETGGTYKAVGR